MADFIVLFGLESVHEQDRAENFDFSISTFIKNLFVDEKTICKKILVIHSQRFREINCDVASFVGWVEDSK